MLAAAGRSLRLIRLPVCIQGPGASPDGISPIESGLPCLGGGVRFVRAGLLTVAVYRGGSIDRLRAPSADDSPLPGGSIGVVPRRGSDRFDAMLDPKVSRWRESLE
jgi:hypothetical protein